MSPDAIFVLFCCSIPLSVLAVTRMYATTRMTSYQKYLFAVCAGIGLALIADAIADGIANRERNDLLRAKLQRELLTEKLQREAAEFPSGRRHSRQYYPKNNWGWRRNQR